MLWSAAVNDPNTLPRLWWGSRQIYYSKGLSFSKPLMNVRNTACGGEPTCALRWAARATTRKWTGRRGRKREFRRKGTAYFYPLDKQWLANGPEWAWCKRSLCPNSRIASYHYSWIGRVPLHERKTCKSERLTVCNQSVNLWSHWHFYSYQIRFVNVTIESYNV